MKKIQLGGIVAAFVLAFAAGTAFCADAQATLSKMQGAVKVRTSDTAAWQAATEGMKLGAGGAVRCDAASSVFLNWRGNTVKVHPLSEFKVNSLKHDPATGAEQSDLELLNGKSFARAKKLTGADSTFNIKTPSAIAGVRGTDFAVSVSEDQTTSVAVVDGEVAVAAGGVEMMVTESLQTVVEMGAPPMEPAPIPPDVMQELQADAQEVVEVEAAVEEAAGEEEAAAEEEEEGEEEEAAAEEEGEGEEEATGEEEAAAEGEAAPEETAEGEMPAAEEAAAMGDIADIVSDTTTDTLDTNLNSDINQQAETIFTGCCAPRE